MQSMIGSDYEKIAHFISSIDEWQCANYIAECFSNPEVIEKVDPNDLQVQQFIDFLKEYCPKNVLDYGGGKARLGKSLMTSNYENKNVISYEVYDPYITEEDQADLNEHNIVFYTDIFKMEVGKYDCVVLMNTLHEIDPKEWEAVFDNIYNFLSDDGYLLFVEVYALRSGEFPQYTDFGYMVLGNAELQKLMRTDQRISEIKNERAGKKSFCAVLPKSQIVGVTKSSVTETIRTLRDNAYCKLKEERKKKIEEKETYSSRRYAFYLQQYINAKLYCEQEDPTASSEKSSEQSYNVLIHIGNIESE